MNSTYHHNPVLVFRPLAQLPELTHPDVLESVVSARADHLDDMLRVGELTLLDLVVELHLVHHQLLSVGLRRLEGLGMAWVGGSYSYCQVFRRPP